MEEKDRQEDNLFASGTVRALRPGGVISGGVEHENTTSGDHEISKDAQAALLGRAGVEVDMPASKGEPEPHHSPFVDGVIVSPAARDQRTREIIEAKQVPRRQ